MKQPRIVVLGAGSIGCFVGSGWIQSGLDVTLVGRQWLLDDIGAHGVCLTDYAGWKAELPGPKVGATSEHTALADADIVLLCVKSTGTTRAAEHIAANAKPGAIVVSFQNGISNVETLRSLLPRQIVLAGMVPFNVAYLGNGRWHKGTNGNLVAENHPALAPLVGALAGTPWALDLSDTMTEVAWGKLLLNLNNAINALSGTTLLRELSDRNYRRVLAASIREALGVLKAAGVQPAKVGPLPPGLLPLFIGAPDWFFNTVGLRLQKIDANARSSMSDDFANNRNSEIDYLNGEVTKLAAGIGARATINERIVRFVKEAERGGRRQWSGADLLAACRAAATD